MTAIKNKLTIFLLVIFSFSIIIGVKTVYAVDTDLNEQVQSAEEIRNDGFRTYLGLDLPIETDNPNYQIEFTEPDDTDVEIKIDDGDYSVKKSPYTLPSLSIGRHVVTFKFEDEDGVEQTIAEILIILPRSPVFSSAEDLSFVSGDVVTFSGTALPNSSVVLLISSDLVMEIANADGEGDWSMTVSEVLSEGSHQVVGFVRKDGYASDFSDAITFNVGSAASSELTVGEPDNPFNLNIDIDWSEIFSEENKYYFIGAGGVLLLVLLVFVGSSVKSTAVSGKDIEKLNNGKKEEKGEKVTLREKLSASKNKTEELKEAIDKATKGKDMQTGKKGDEKEVEEPVKDAAKGGTSKSSAQGSSSGGKEPVKTVEKVESKKDSASPEAIPQSGTKQPKLEESKINQGKGFFSFLKRKEKKSKVENPEDVKKVVSKEEFLEDFKPSSPSASTNQGDGRKIEIEETKEIEKEKKKKDKSKPQVKEDSEKVDDIKPDETKVEEKPKDKKSNTIEVTLT